MKRSLCFFVLLFNAANIIAQTVSPALTLDERGRYSFYEVVDYTHASQSVLISKCKEYFKLALKKSLVLKAETDSSLIAKGKFVLSKSMLQVSHPVGEVYYILHLEVRNNKYRYWFTDFIFTPYERDRYGNFVPVQGMKTPLETKTSKLNKVEWEGYIAEVGDQTKKSAERLKLAMADKLPKPTQKYPAKRINTKNW